MPDEIEPLLYKLSATFEKSLDFILSSRVLHQMTELELKQLASFELVDLQLHTHNHDLPLGATAAKQELAHNRAFLRKFCSTPRVHFCYPSGKWDVRHIPILKQSGIKSATTCVQGLNDNKTERLALKRFVDGEHIRQIQFEAAVSGFFYLAKSAKSKLKMLFSLFLRARKKPHRQTAKDFLAE